MHVIGSLDLAYTVLGIHLKILFEIECCQPVFASAVISVVRQVAQLV
jgi:hypothetical protein